MTRPAAAFRQAGLVLMVASLRGGNDNPGQKQGFAGEIDDVVAAGGFLALQPYVDPAPVYLGGHSTGGTMVLLTAEASDRFRAVFAFGPRARAEDHRQFDQVDFAKLDPPLFVLEGSGEGLLSVSNIDALEWMRQKSLNPNIAFLPVTGATPFHHPRSHYQAHCAKDIAG